MRAVRAGLLAGLMMFATLSGLAPLGAEADSLPALVACIGASGSFVDGVQCANPPAADLGPVTKTVFTGGGDLAVTISDELPGPGAMPDRVSAVASWRR